MIKKVSNNGALDPVLELLPIRGPEGHPALRVYSSILAFLIFEMSVIQLERDSKVRKKPNLDLR